jgi:hypothetical protein
MILTVLKHILMYSLFTHALQFLQFFLMSRCAWPTKAVLIIQWFQLVSDRVQEEGPHTNSHKTG